MSDSPAIFSACPHDVAKDPEKWNEFTDYINDEAGTAFECERHLDFGVFEENFPRFSFAYAHPLHAVKLFKNFGFVPLAKYDRIFDEAALIANRSVEHPSVEDMNGRKTALIVGSPSHAATLIELSRKYSGVSLVPLGKEKYPSVLTAVTIGEAEYGIILKSVWDDMIALKDRVRHFHTTSTGELVHVFMVAPAFAAKADAIRQALLGMNRSEHGREILDRLECSGMIDFGASEIEALERSLGVCHF